MISEARSNRQGIVVLLALGGVVAYTAFEWGGVVRTGRYQYLLASGLLAMWLGFKRSRGESLPPGRVMLWAAVLLPAYVLLQTIPLPLAILRVISPIQAAAVDSLAPVGVTMSFAPLSVFPAGTFQYFLLVCGYLVIFLLVRELTWHLRKRRWLVIWPILSIAALEAGLGLWQSLGGTGEQVRWGTYANYNHYAGFLEMALPFAVMCPFAILRRTHFRWGASVVPALAASGVWALGCLIFSGIVFSYSRMGFIATLSSLFLMGALVLGTTQLRWLARSGKRRLVGVGILAAIVLGSFVLLPPERLIQRFGEFASTDGLTGEGRTNLWVETIPLIKAYPAFGCGLGGYETAFSRFKISGVLVTDDFAHNDYLQLLAELGAVGFVIGAVLAFSVVSLVLREAVNSPDPDARYFAVASMGALSAIALHSLADFNLYIPANAMLLAWIAGMALGSRGSTMRIREMREQRTVISLEAPEAVSF